jgi:tRNA (guanine-N7-)-methyltransferase
MTSRTPTPSSPLAGETVLNDAARNARRRYQEDTPRAPEGGFDLFELFPPSSDIEMEIGFGRGLFIVQRAAAAPDTCLVGIEIKKKLVYRVEQRRKRLGLERVRVMAGDARAVLPQVRPDAALARVFVHFPDPWWKKRHAKRRLLAEPLLDQIARLLRPGGELFVQTDVEDRAEQCLAQLREHAAFDLPAEGRLEHNPYGARSNREQRAIEDGLPVYRILARRRPAPSGA